MIRLAYISSKEGVGPVARFASSKLVDLVA